MLESVGESPSPRELRRFVEQSDVQLGFLFKRLCSSVYSLLKCYRMKDMLDRV